MKEHQQEKKKTEKHRDPMKHSSYRSRAARRLRKLARRMPEGTAKELEAKAKKLEAGAKRRHSKVAPWMVVSAENAKYPERWAWDLLHPKAELHNPLVAVVAVLEVSTMGRVVNADPCPIVAVAWDKRVRGTRKHDPEIPNAPLSVVAQMGELDETVYRLY